MRRATAIVSRRHFFYEALATCVATLAGHSKIVTAVAFDPTGRLVATGSRDNSQTLEVKRLLHAFISPRIIQKVSTVTVTSPTCHTHCTYHNASRPGRLA